jgi:hypothetical protein
MDDNRELYHHGILGMRWGVRRGSNVSTGKNSKVGKKNLTPEPSEDHKITRRLSKKSTSELSNNELETLTKRLNLEKRYLILKI